MRGVATLVVLGCVGCTFPDVTYGAPDASLGADVSTGEDASTNDVAVIADVATYDGPTSLPDGSVDPDAANCDRDHDTFLSGIKGCSTTQVDCDDQDDRVNPGVSTPVFAFPSSTMPIKGDWNCDGKVDFTYPRGTTCPVSLSSCASVAGFADTPFCGTLGNYITCAGVAVCGAVDAGTKTEGCL